MQAFNATRSILPSALRIERRYHSLLEPPEAAVRLLNQFKPDLVQGFGSYFAVLFAYLEQAATPFHRPKAISYSSDALPAAARELIERRFGIPVFSTYQAGEAFKIGFECERHQGLHINDDLYPLRIVDPDGRTVPHGETGDVVVSNLVNRAMVLLNYRLGDRGVVGADHCSCGRTLPLLARLEGRIGEALVHTGARALSMGIVEAVLWPELWSTLLYQVVQPAAGQPRLLIVPRADIDPAALRQKIVSKWRSTFGEDTALEVEFVEDVARTAQGKVKRLVTAPSARPSPCDDTPA